MISTLRAWAALEAALLLAGCATLFAPLENPRISIVSMRVLPATGVEQRIEVGLRVMNPNGFALEANGLVLEAGFNDIPVLNGALPDPPAVPAYGETQMTIVLSASLLNGIRLVRSLMEHPDDPLHYQLEARLDLKLPIARSITVFEQGEISARPPQAPAKSRGETL